MELKIKDLKDILEVRSRSTENILNQIRETCDRAFWPEVYNLVMSNENGKHYRFAKGNIELKNYFEKLGFKVYAEMKIENSHQVDTEFLYVV